MEDTQDLVNDFVDWEMAVREELTAPFSDMVIDWRMFRNQRRDPRQSHEAWRALTCTPKPFKTALTTTGQIWDIINAGDPPIQAVGIGDEDQEIARKVERLEEMTLNVNRWALRSYLMALEMAIQGTTATKVMWRDKTMRVRDNSSGVDAAFAEAIANLQAMNVKVPDNPDEYEEVRMARPDGIVLPPHPRRAFRDIKIFSGPATERVDVTDLRFDVKQDEWSLQRRKAQRSVKPLSWVMARTGPGSDKPFDPQAVADATFESPDSRLNQWQRDIAAMLGVDPKETAYTNRAAEMLVELWEVFDFENEDRPYYIIMNRKTIITKERFSPYGYDPLHLVRLHPIPGLALGQSALKAPRKLFEEHWALRDLRLDSVTLATLPIFQTLNGIGIPDIAKVFRPGAAIQLPSPGALSKLDLGSVHPDIWKEVDALGAEIDDVTATYGNVRGMPSTVGRVSAAESGQRASSAIQQHKVSAALFEAETREMIRGIVGCWYEHGDPEILVKIGGIGTDKYMQTISKDELAVALDMDFQFRGPARAINREMQVQQGLQWFTTFGALLAPHRQLAFAQNMYELLGLKEKAQVIPDSDIALKVQEMQQQALAAQQQAAAQAQAQAQQPQALPDQAGQPPAAPPPQEAPPPEQAPPQPMPEEIPQEMPPQA